MLLTPIQIELVLFGRLAENWDILYDNDTSTNEAAYYAKAYDYEDIENQIDTGDLYAEGITSDPSRPRPTEGRP